jgi:hypothetical protein
MSMVPDSAFVEVHVSVTFWPATMVEGVAVRVAVGIGPDELLPFDALQLAITSDKAASKTHWLPRTPNSCFTKFPDKARPLKSTEFLIVPIVSPRALLAGARSGELAQAAFPAPAGLVTPS